MPKERRQEAAREEHDLAVDDLQDAVDRSTGPGGDEEAARRNLRRAVRREREAAEALGED